MSNGQKVIDRCRELAAISDSTNGTLRTFLSPAMRRCYETVGSWMQLAGMQTHIDNAGNLRGFYAGDGSCRRPLLLGSHLDTVPNAGAFDGILGVIAAIQMVDMLRGSKLPFDIQVIGFSEEEGVRFGTPFIGSHALAGTLSDAMLMLKDADGITVSQAIRDFGLDPAQVCGCTVDAKPLAFLECHIEQGPVLDHANESLAIVDSIAGLTRAFVTFTGQANHAGTTPLELRRDALCGAAEWICGVENVARSHAGLVATVGKIEASPGVVNAVPGTVNMTLDCRHASDAQRHSAIARLRGMAEDITKRRGLYLEWSGALDQPATPMHAGLVDLLDMAARKSGLQLRRMSSGAGHDAMILAARIPSVMLFLRSPGGLSHHPDEAVLLEDVDNALMVAAAFIQSLKEAN